MPSRERWLFDQQSEMPKWVCAILSQLWPYMRWEDNYFVSVAKDDTGKEMQAERPDNIQRKQA